MQYERSSTQVLVLVCMADSMKEGFCNPFFKTLVTLVTESLSIMKLGMIERLCAREINEEERTGIISREAHQYLHDTGDDELKMSRASVFFS